MLPQILSGLTAIPTAHASDWEPIQSNRIYIAPPDHHMLLEDGHVRVTHGPKENRFRPAIDPLFRSAAYAYSNRVINALKDPPFSKLNLVSCRTLLIYLNLTAQLRDALREQGELLRAASHDLRGMVGVIASAAQLLGMTDGDTDQNVLIQMIRFQAGDR